MQAKWTSIATASVLITTAGLGYCYRNAHRAASIFPAIEKQPLRDAPGPIRAGDNDQTGTGLHPEAVGTAVQQLEKGAQTSDVKPSEIGTAPENAATAASDGNSASPHGYTFSCPLKCQMEGYAQDFPCGGSVLEVILGGDTPNINLVTSAGYYGATHPDWKMDSSYPDVPSGMIAYQDMDKDGIKALWIDRQLLKGKSGSIIIIGDSPKLKPTGLCTLQPSASTPPLKDTSGLQTGHAPDPNAQKLP